MGGPAVSWKDRTSATSYRFMRVSRSTGYETDMIRVLKGGSITRNNDVRIMETAEAELVGSLNVGPDFIRVYMDASWPSGETESVVLGTFLPVIPSRDVKHGYSRAKVKMYGRLQELLDDKFSSPITLAKGTNAVEAAVSVCEQQGLEVIADPSDYTISDVRMYGLGAQQNNSSVGDTKLDMVNNLLDLAGFRAAKTDPMGRILMKRYADPMSIAPSWSFDEGPMAKFESDMTDERDITSAANHVVVRYESEGEIIVGEAYDTDPASDLSTVSRGRVITRTYEYTSLPEGETASDRQAYANQRAQTLLRTAQATIRRITLTHPYAPITVNDTCTVSYRSGGVEGLFEVRVQKLSLTGGCPVNAELRQFRRNG